MKTLNGVGRSVFTAMNLKIIKSFLISVLITLAITAIWYGFEWIQFGELQWERECDNVVTYLYLIALTIGYTKWFER